MSKVILTKGDKTIIKMTETLVNAENKPEMDQIHGFAQSLNQDEREELYVIRHIKGKK